MAVNITNHLRLGHYQTNNKIFINKAEALIEASRTNSSIYWNFNDGVFSAIDWRVPIETSLSDLYKQRAQQLRDKYDFISLYYSGGVDSTNVLHSFIDNDIPIDEIVMYKPKVIHEYNTLDRTNNNVFSEILYAAIPHLNKTALQSKISSVRLLDIDSATSAFLNNSKLVEQYQTLNLYMPTGAGRLAMGITDPVWNDLYSKGKRVAHIHGIDKPTIKITNSIASFQFLDTCVASAVYSPHYESDHSEMLNSYQFNELFYWTPDLPQLVIKQCQSVMRAATVAEYRTKLENSDRWKQDKMTFIHDYIYPPHVNSVRDLFCTQKPGQDIYAGQGQWFYEKMPAQDHGVFFDIVRNMQKCIDSKYFRGPNNTNYYLSDPDEGSPKIALRTIKSKEYCLGKIIG